MTTTITTAESNSDIEDDPINFDEEPVVCVYTSILIAMEEENRRRLRAAAALEEDATEERLAFDDSELD